MLELERRDRVIDESPDRHHEHLVEDVLSFVNWLNKSGLYDQIDGHQKLTRMLHYAMIAAFADPGF